ncbi:MAG: ATP-binding protein [Ferruginibacter sp.]|nr:ATP-binding protein [Cytophagales bacterium]
MKTIVFFLSVLLPSWFTDFPSPGQPPATAASLVKKWETEATLKVPESVLFDARQNVLYVSNINGQSGEKDGNGFLSKVSLDGKIETLEWVTGLDAPKGMGLYNNRLYVADLTDVVVIDTRTGKILQRMALPDASFLNDVTVTRSGDVYVSDSSRKRIYLVQGDKVTIWLESNDLKKPNGLLVAGSGLSMLDMDAGIFYQVDLKSKKLIKFAEGVSSGDGVVAAGDDSYLVSNWNGEVSSVDKTGKVEKLLDTKDQKLGAADIEYIPGKKLLLVPTFFGNKVVAYELVK